MAEPVVIQSVLGVQGGGIPFLFPNTSGNTIVVYYAYTGGTGPSISDTQGNSYTAYAQVSEGYNSGFFVATGIAAGANTVSISTLGGGGVYGILEYAGVTGIETSDPTAGPITGTSLSFGPITTTAANTKIILLASSGGNGPFSNSSSWSARDNIQTIHVTEALFEFAAGNGSNYSPTITAQSSSLFLQGGMIGLKGSGAAPGGGGGSYTFIG